MSGAKLTAGGTSVETLRDILKDNRIDSEITSSVVLNVKVGQKIEYPLWVTMYHGNEGPVDLYATAYIDMDATNEKKDAFVWDLNKLGLLPYFAWDQIRLDGYGHDTLYGSYGIPTSGGIDAEKFVSIVLRLPIEFSSIKQHDPDGLVTLGDIGPL
jgi:hypothetical protein